MYQDLKNFKIAGRHVYFSPIIIREDLKTTRPITDKEVEIMEIGLIEALRPRYNVFGINDKYHL